MACHGYTQQFFQSERTLIMVDDAMRAQFCNVPNVMVYHRTETGSLIAAMVSVELDGMPLERITIDHGGRASGIIKIK